MAQILLAEDDSTMRQFLTAALEKVGHKVIPCEDGLSALEQAENHAGDIDLLLADIIMPGLDGIELSQRVMELCPGAKVVFITGFSGVAVTANQSNESHARVLSKPFHLNDLIEQIETVLVH